MHEFSGAAAYHHPGTAGTLPGVAGAPRDVVGGAVFENFRRYRSICLFKDAKNARTSDRFTPWSGPIGCAWAGHFAWQKWGGNFKQGENFFAPRCTGKGGKLNTSQAEPVAANSWALGQFLSISCEAFR